MKKFIALVLSLVFVMGSTMNVHATDLSTDGATASAEVIYNVNSSYIITIPSELYLSSEEYRFEATYLNICENEVVSVRITNLIDDCYLEMTNSNGETEYMTIHNVDITGKCAEFTKGSTTSNVGFYASMSDTASAGEWRGTAEFCISVGAQ